MSDSNFYRKWAKWYTNQTYLKRIDAVVHVEGETDKSFWQKVLSHAGLRVRPVAGSDNLEDQTSGKKQCLKYLPYLNPRFFVCVDSDYDYLKKQQPENFSKFFVLQTYTYAIENHYLASNAGLQNFLQKYANIIYPAFLSHLAENSPIDEFCRFVAPKSPVATTLEKLQQNVWKRYPDEKPNLYTAAGLNADNVYLFMKAKLLKSALKCGEYLTFDHFPMNKIFADIAALPLRPHTPPHRR
jgi:hypothetical protein